MAGDSSKTVIIAAIVGNFAVAVTKFVVAAISGSSAMLSEGIHSLVDTGNGGLLLWGIRRSKRPPDEEHPFGHGLELYFWTLIVAVLIFGVGGGVSIYEGILHLIHPQPVTNAFWIYVALGAGVLFEGIAWYLALRGFLAAMGERGAWQTIRETKDPTLFAVLLEDSAALAGLFVAFLGVFLATHLGNPYFDGAASIMIGLILMTVATVLASESRKLLIGESAEPAMVASIRTLAVADPAVERARKPLTMHFGPHNVLVNLDVQFRRTLSTTEVEQSIDRLEKAIRQAHPDVSRIFLEAESITPRTAADHGATVKPQSPSG